MDILTLVLHTVIGCHGLLHPGGFPASQQMRDGACTKGVGEPENWTGGPGPVNPVAALTTGLVKAVDRRPVNWDPRSLDPAIRPAIVFWVTRDCQSRHVSPAYSPQYQRTSNASNSSLALLLVTRSSRLKRDLDERLRLLRLVSHAGSSGWSLGWPRSWRLSAMPSQLRQVGGKWVKNFM